MPLGKILIADDHEMTRTGIKLLLLHFFPQVEIVEACNGKEAIAQYDAHKPDVLLIDYRMPEMAQAVFSQLFLIQQSLWICKI